MLKVIVFDFNGVLLDDLEYQVDSYVQACRDMGFDVARETIKHFINYPPVQKKNLYFNNISDSDWQKLFQLKLKHYHEMVNQADLLFSDVEDVLSSLAAKYTLALISNTVRSLFERTFPRRLANLFRVTLFADEVAEPKPSPEPLLKVIQTLGVGTHECCYVGDSVEDVRMARAAGVKLFSITTGACSREELAEAGADRLVADLKELVRQLECCD